jgi:hypothetical protein
VAVIEQPAQEAALIGRRKRNPCVQMGVTAGPDTRPGRALWRIVSHPMKPTPRSDRSTAVNRAMVTRWRSEIGSNRAIEIANGRSSALPRRRRQRIRRYHAGGNALSGVERGAESIMRAQAVAATTIAPVIAIACLQPLAGMPMCARRVRHNIPRLRPAPRRGARSLRE